MMKEIRRFILLCRALTQGLSRFFLLAIFFCDNKLIASSLSSAIASERQYDVNSLYATVPVI